MVPIGVHTRHAFKNQKNTINYKGPPGSLYITMLTYLYVARALALRTTPRMLEQLPAAEQM